jgi:ATP-dependent 26S proteasome regulatory subunit
MAGIPPVQRLHAEFSVQREMASATQGMTGANIAYVRQRAAMFCVKEAAGGSNESRLAVAALVKPL